MLATTANIPNATTFTPSNAAEFGRLVTALASPLRREHTPLLSRRWVAAGMLGALVMAAFYTAVVWVASRSFGHLVDQVRTDWYLLILIVAGFATQVAFLAEWFLMPQGTGRHIRTVQRLPETNATARQPVVRLEASGLLVLTVEVCAPSNRAPQQPPRHPSTAKGPDHRLR